MTPPSKGVRPPVSSNLQELPFEELTWENFEKLCVRLARLEGNVEHCQRYGVQGDEQEGIDLYARQKSSTYRVYQCKNEKGFGPKKIEEAVTEFLEGDWLTKTDTFVLCTRESLAPVARAKELEKQATKLKSQGITLIPWDRAELSLKLKGLPDIVHDFFSREWVEQFCGDEAAAKLHNRLDAYEAAAFRAQLGEFYRHLFNNHDPGLPLFASADEPPPPLESRYVLPDINEHRVITQGLSEARESRLDAIVSRENISARLPQRGEREIELRRLPVNQTSRHTQRQGIEKWLTSHERNIVLGPAGSGKSSLLRFLCIDLMAPNPQLSLLAEKWGQHLPIWIPFAFWSKQVASSPNGDISLREALRRWLRSWEHEPLWKLVEQALEDDRVLLLVDGLDEYRDKFAAQKAWLRLKMFVEERGVSSIVTSRPAGFERLGINTSGWQKGELSEFSPEQQEQLARIWFIHRSETSGKSHTADDLAVAQFDAAVESFMRELDRSNDLRELARVPLLLCLLIAHKVQHLVLPRNRFKAYDNLIEYLIATHPRQRALAAAADGVSFEVDERDLKAIFAKLAYEMHREFGEGLIEQTVAEEIVAKYLGADDGIFGFEVAKARALSRDLVNVGEQALGLLVRGSQVDLSFLHRALQEYLAACYLATLPLSDQLSLVDDVCTDPRWNDSILSLLYITQSTQSVTALVDHIRAKETNALGSYGVAELLSEVAFGDFNLTVKVAKELASESFIRVETESWLPHRERLLENVIGGLRSVRTREVVQPKLRTWFPDHTRWTRGSVFLAMRDWSPTPDVRERLLLGLRDEYSDIQRAASSTLAYLFNGDEVTQDLVAAIAWGEDNPRIRAAAIECLFKGWPNCGKLTNILDAARTSVFPRLRLVAIAGRVERNEQTDEDRTALFRLGMGDVGLDYRWRDLLVTALAQGWHNSTEVKKKCLDAVEKSRNALSDARLNFDKAIAKAVLLVGFPQDDNVAKLFAREVNWDQIHLDNVLPSDTGFFDLIGKQFPMHPAVIEAVDKWLVRQERKGRSFFRAALVGRTSIAKSLLLKSLDTKHLPFAVQALLQGWGMQDLEVAETLTTLVHQTETEAAYCGEYLPDIIPKPNECRARLLELLASPHHRAGQYLLAGLIRLGGNQGDTEVVDAALELPLNSEGKHPALGNLIKGYSLDPRVRELAKAELRDPHGHLGVVASAYGDDEEFRFDILQSVTPLPEGLRQLIAQRLGDADDGFSLSLLESYNSEVDVETRVQASISYHKRLKHSNAALEPAVEILRQRIVSVDSEGLKTRHAAFCGLVELRRLDVVKNVEDGFSDKRCRIPLERERVLPSVSLQRIILKNWDYIHKEFGEEFWDRFDAVEEREQGNFWYHLSAFADEYPQPQAEFIEFIRNTRNDDGHSAWSLRFLNRAAPRSELLKQLCMIAVAGKDNKFDDSYEEALLAAELLVKNFNEDETIWQWLKSNIKDDYEEEVPENIILALSEGWPASIEFARIAKLVDEREQGLTFPAVMYLSCRRDNAADVLAALDRLLFWFDRSDISRNSQIVRPIVRRLKQDDELLQLMIVKLQDHPSTTEKATYLQLINQARGVAVIKDWCVQEYERQESGMIEPEIGVDATQGEFMPITHIILSALQGTS
jgi:energy-coupling factor transporter ATP-binding protein EcfA2